MTQQQIQEARKFADFFHRDGSLAGKLCCDILLYVSAPPSEWAEGLVYFQNRALSLVGEKITFVRNGDKARFKKRPRDLTAMLQAWLAKGGERQGSYVLSLQAGAQAEEPSDHGFEFVYVLGNGHLRLVLPLESIAANAAEFRELAIDLASHVPFRWGTAGLAINMDPDYGESREGSAVAQIANRYPAVDAGNPLFWGDLTLQGIKTVNWLTFLGKDFLSRVMTHFGKPLNFATSLGKLVDGQEIPGGAFLQAGPEPLLGDEGGDKLEPYRQVSRTLFPALQIPDQVLRNYDGIGGTENTRKWLNRFN